MIRVMYRWTVKKENQEEFVRTWEDRTLKIQTHCAGAMGSILLRSPENPEHFFGMSHWPNKEVWKVYVVRTFETNRCGKSERSEPSGWGSGDGLLMQAPP